MISLDLELANYNPQTKSSSSLELGMVYTF